MFINYLVCGYQCFGQLDWSRGENSTLYPVGQFSSKDKFGFLGLIVIHVLLGRKKAGGSRRSRGDRRRERRGGEGAGGI